MRFLMVCTANVCRSPMAAALLERQCAQRGLEVVVRSAGTHAGVVDADPETIAAMARRDIDLSAHRPRLLVREMCAEDGHDLIVAMTREHLRSVAVLGGPAAVRRTFTAKELARRAVGLHRIGDDEERGGSVGEWVVAAGGGRSLRDLMGSDPDDDIDDPFSLSAAQHVQTADEIDALMSTIASSLTMWMD